MELWEIFILFVGWIFPEIYINDTSSNSIWTKIGCAILIIFLVIFFIYALIKLIK